MSLNLVLLAAILAFPLSGRICHARSPGFDEIMHIAESCAPFGFSTLRKSDYGCIVARIVEPDTMVRDQWTVLEVEETLRGTTTLGLHEAAGVSGVPGDRYVLLVIEPAADPLRISGPGQYPFTPERRERAVRIIQERIACDRNPKACEASHESLRVAQEGSWKRKRDQADIDELCQRASGVFVADFQSSQVLEFGGIVCVSLTEILKAEGDLFPTTLPDNHYWCIWLPDSAAMAIDAVFGALDRFIVFVNEAPEDLLPADQLPRVDMVLADDDLGALPATGRFLRAARRACTVRSD